MFNKKKFRMDGYIDYPGKGRITDEMVYDTVIKHSRLIDRLNPRKWVEMTLYGQCVLMGVVDVPEEDNWKFYGKNGLFN